MFILVKPISGLAGQVTRTRDIDWRFITPLLLAVFIGGQIVSRLGARKFHPLYIKRITSLVIFAAAIKILIHHV